MSPKSEAELMAENASLHERLAKLEACLAGQLNGEAILSANSLAEQKRVEAALKASEILYRRLFETAKDGILILDADTGAIIDANPFLEDMLGYTHAELIGKTLWEIGPLDDIAASREAFQQLLAKDYIRYENLPLETKAKKSRQVEFVSNVYLVNGIRVVQCNIRDITDRKRAEEALRESEERYRELFEAESDAIFLIDNATGDILEANSAAAALYGYDQDELLTKRNVDLSAEPEDTQRVTHGTPIISDRVVTIPLRYHLKKDGTVFPVEITGRFFIRQGHPVHIAAIRDITARKQVEDALRVKDWAIESAINAIAISDLEGNLNYVNPAFLKLWGYGSPAEVRGKPVVGFWQIGEKAAEVIEALRARGAWLGEMVAKREDGSLFDVQVAASLVIDDIGRPICMLASFADITELKQALAREQRFARADALTGVNSRRYWFELAEHEFEVALRYRHPLSVIMIDIDHFKQVNDTFGHRVGDQMLECVAQAARAELRSADVIGRYGGEEFVIVLPVTTAQQAYPVAERIRTVVAGIRKETDKGQAAITLSIGIAETLLAPAAESPGADESIERVIHRADEALYAAKAAGRNRTATWSEPAERPGRTDLRQQVEAQLPRQPVDHDKIPPGQAGP